MPGTIGETDTIDVTDTIGATGNGGAAGMLGGSGMTWTRRTTVTGEFGDHGFLASHLVR